MKNACQKKISTRLVVFQCAQCLTATVIPVMSSLTENNRWWKIFKAIPVHGHDWQKSVRERKKVIFSYTALCQSLPVSNFLTCNLLTASDHSLQTGCFSNDAASTMLACSLQQINFVSTIQDENTTGLIGYIIYFAYWLYHLFILLIYFC